MAHADSNRGSPDDARGWSMIDKRPQPNSRGSLLRAKVEASRSYCGCAQLAIGAVFKRENRVAVQW